MLLVILVTTQCLSKNVIAHSKVTDIEKHWAKEMIQKWVERDIIHGNGKGEFQPEKLITKAELYTIINNVLGYTDTNTTGFNDVKSQDWYYNDLLKARSAGYLTVYDNNKVNPKEYVRRQDAFKAIVEAFKIKINNDEEKLNFSDEKKINPYAYGAVKSLVKNGAVLRFSNNTIRPNDYISKVELLSVIDKLIGEYIDKPGTYTLSKDNKGIVIVNSKDVIIKDSTIKSSLIIAQSVGDGEVTLENSTVEGDVHVQGGGENSIKLKNCKIASIIVDRKNGKVRIVAEGNTSVEKASVSSNTKLENNSEVGFKDIEIDTQFNNYEIELVGTFDKIVIDSPAKVKLVGKTEVKNLTVAPKSKPVIETSKDTFITNLQVDSSLEILGKGNITNSVINAEDVKIEAKVKNIFVSKNVDAPIINGKEYKEPPKNNDYPTTTPSSGGGSSNVSSSDNNNNNNNNNNEDIANKFLVGENEYIKLYSSLELVDSKVNPKSELIIVTKDGYSIVDGSYVLQYIQPEKDNGIFFSTPYNKPIKSLKIEPNNSSKSLLFGQSVKLILFSSVIKDELQKRMEKVIIEFNTQEYPEESEASPVLFNKISNINLIANKYHQINLSGYIYHPSHKNIIYNISVSDTDSLNASIQDNKLSIKGLNTTSEPVIVTVKAIDEKGKELQEEFNVNIIDPIKLEYKEVNDGIDYIQVILLNGYGIEKEHLKYLNYIDNKDNVKIKDLIFAEGSDKIVTEFKVYLTDSKENEMDFDTGKVYKYELRCHQFCDMEGKRIKDCVPRNVYVLIDYKNELLDNDYFTLYSDKQLVEGKVKIDSRLVLEFKNGVGVSQENYYRFIRFLGGKNSFSQEKYEDQPNITKKIFINNSYNLSDSGCFKYGVSYKMLFDYSKLINKDGTSLNLKDKKSYSIDLEEYNGDKNIIAVGDFKDFVISEGIEMDMLNYAETIYSPSGKVITFKVTSSDEDICTVSEDGKIIANKIGKCIITIIANDGTDSVDFSFNLNVTKSPISYEYIDDRFMDYIKIKFENGYDFYMVNITNGLKLFNDYKSVDYKLDVVSEGEYKLYAIDSGNKINFKKDKYKINANTCVIENEKGTLNNYLNSSFDFEFQGKNTPVQKIKDFTQEASTEKIILNLDEYFNDIDGDNIIYNISENIEDGQSQQLDITSNSNEYSFDAKADSINGNTVNVTIKATDDEQPEPTKVDIIFTITEKNGKKVLTMTEKTKEVE
jgi:hypothetical protein